MTGLVGNCKTQLGGYNIVDRVESFIHHRLSFHLFCQSGNPTGRPKGSKSIIKALRDALNDGEGGEQIINALVYQALKQAISGDFKFWNAIIERIDGKVADKVIATTEISGWDIEYEVEDSSVSSEPI